MSKTQDILLLLEKGFVPYPCRVPKEFYEARRCRIPENSLWFMRPFSHEQQDVRCICLGCKKRCAATNPQGWPTLAAGKKASRPGVVAFTVVQRLSADELLRAKKVLRVEEAAWVLNVSRQKVREWMEEGVLDPVPGTPIRVTVSSVQRNLEPEY